MSTEGTTSGTFGIGVAVEMECVLHVLRNPELNPSAYAGKGLVSLDVVQKWADHIAALEALEDGRRYGALPLGAA